MFTGIVHGIGILAARSATRGDARLTIRSDTVGFERFAEGESICVAGVCLTAFGIEPDSFEADVSVETLRLTTLGSMATGARVNLEPSLALGDRLGGHMVTGHIDGVGAIAARSADARSLRLRLDLAPPLMRYVARKGSVAVDGVSLTVNAVSDSGFEVNIIPHTSSVTTLSDVKVGDQVNVEVDLMARYAERLALPDAGVTHELLRRHGYEQ